MKRRRRVLKPNTITPRVSDECGGPFTVEAWRYIYRKYQHVFVHVKDAAGQWVQCDFLVPR